MKILLLGTITVGLFVSGLTACVTAPSLQIPPASTQSLTSVKKTMKAFASEKELAKYLANLAEKQKRKRSSLDGLVDTEAQNAAPLAKSSSESDKDEESVTNVQHAGVDEGGIVKVHGNHLVVLRRGRLFTIAIGDGALRPISTIDAFGPDIDPRGTWYDEMLVSRNIVIVIGYSYQRGGTEVGLFQIADDGKLSYKSTYHLRSNDYYSSRNYASRLVGDKLIFYTPLYFYPGEADPFQTFPAVRKWHRGATENEFRRIVPATRVYRPQSNFNTDYDLALHTVDV